MEGEEGMSEGEGGEWRVKEGVREREGEGGERGLEANIYQCALCHSDQLRFVVSLLLICRE